MLVNLFIKMLIKYLQRDKCGGAYEFIKEMNEKKQKHIHRRGHKHRSRNERLAAGGEGGKEE